MRFALPSLTEEGYNVDMHAVAAPAITSAQPSAPARRRHRRSLLSLALLPLLVVALLPSFYNHLRAANILAGISGTQLPAALQLDTNPVVEEETTFVSTGLNVRARIYHPIGIAHPSPLVVAHGVHHLGIDEPRLRNFARTLAAHGYLVMTPQLDSLADYRISVDSVAVIGDAVHELARRSGAPRVGLLGISFAGGLALIAAADESVQQQLSVIIAIGAHDDLGRVLAFYENDETGAPDGSVLKMKAHEYGSLVTAYGYVSKYFSRRDAPRAERALRALLWEDLPRAHAEAAKLSRPGRARMALLFAHDTKSLVPDTQRALVDANVSLIAGSPSHYLRDLHVPVMLLHGAADNVVPPTETLWLAHDLPPGVLKAALISPVISHVDMGNATAMDDLRLIHFMQQMLAMLDTASAERG